MTFVVSGMLWRDSLIMIDRETESLWSHVLGRAIDGPLKGETLTMMASVQTTWGEWRKAHPTTKLLAKNEKITSSHYQKYYDNPEKMGIFRTKEINRILPGKELVWGVAKGPHAAAVVEGAVEANELAQFSLGETAIVAVRGRDGGVRTFVAEHEGKALEFFFDRDGVLRDRTLGSSWDPLTGAATGDKAAGAELEELATSRVYWFAWSSFYPNSAVIEE